MFPHGTESSLSQSLDLPPSAAHLSESEANGLVFIEQLRAERECSAPNRPFLIARDEVSKRLLIYRPGCKMWSCPACAERNRRRWTARIANGVNHYMQQENERFWFVTLSTHENLFSFDAQLAVWRDGWSKLYDRMRRYHSGSLHYALLPELAPETGRLHQHAIVNESFGANPRKSPKKGYSCSWLHDNPRECGLGFANDIKPVESPALAAWYTAGYIGKTLGVSNWPENFRRIRTSTNWPELPELPGQADALAWGVIKPALLDELISQMWRTGYDVVNVNTGQILEVIDLVELLADVKAERQVEPPPAARFENG